MKNPFEYIQQYSKKYIGTYSFDFPNFAKEANVKLIDTSDIGYSCNSQGFRSQEFKLLSNKNYNILFAGCSNTFGEGLPLDKTWFYILNNNIKQYKTNTEYFNIGYGAASIHSIVRNTLSFIENYGKPDIIFMHLPPTSRNLYYSEKLNSFLNCFIWDKFLITKNETYKKFNLSHVEQNGILSATTLLFLLESLCKNAGIKLIWSTWHENSNNLYKNLEFDYFLSMDNRYKEKIPNVNNDPYWDIAADKEHPGSMWSLQFASQNIEEFLRRGYDK